LKNFDYFVGVDWSGSKAVQTKSIALAVCKQGVKPPVLYDAIRSRTAVFEFLSQLIQAKKRCLIGIDANFGYCAKVGTKHFGKNYTAQDQWQVVNSYSRSHENFYAAGFWEHENFACDFWQSGTKPGWFDPKALRRDTERQCIADGYGHPESPFKICYTKQVGKGGLAAMRMAHALKGQYRDAIAIWPFEKQDAYNKADLVLTEIYPRQFLMRCGFGTKKLYKLDDLNSVLPAFDSRQILAGHKVTDHDTDALVSAAGIRYLCGDMPTLPDRLTNPPSLSAKARRCEGWIFGVGS